MDSTTATNLQYRPFGVVLRDLLIDTGITTRLGNPAWSAFADRVPGVSYETLRKAVVGERPPSRKVMEAVGEALGVNPSRFAEYRLWETRRALDPAEVGWERAFAALRRIEGHDESQGR